MPVLGDLLLLLLLQKLLEKWGWQAFFDSRRWCGQSRGTKVNMDQMVYNRKVEEFSIFSCLLFDFDHRENFIYSNYNTYFYSHLIKKI